MARNDSGVARLQLPRLAFCSSAEIFRDMAAAAFNAMNLFGVECSAFAPSASAVDQFYKAVVEDLTVHAVDKCDPQLVAWSVLKTVERLLTRFSATNVDAPKATHATLNYKALERTAEIV